MKRLLFSVFPLCLCLTHGCNKSSESSKADSQSSKTTVPIDQNKLSYHVLAKLLTAPSGANSSTTTPDLALYVSDAKNAVLDIEALKIDDRDLQSIREEGVGAIKDSIVSLRKLQQLPQPPSSDEVFISGFLCGLGGRFDLIAASGDRADKKLNDIIAELHKYNGAYHKACTARLQLKKVATRFSGNDILPNILIDVNEQFILDNDMRVCFTNTTGRELHRALLCVHLIGANGDTTENVHYVEKWGINQKLHAAYQEGLLVQGKYIGRQTVANIDTMKVVIYSDEGQLKDGIYQYAGVERQKDIDRELNVIRPHIATWTRNGALGDGKVLIIHNKSDRYLPTVSVSTPAGAFTHGFLAPNKSFQVGKLQVTRNLKPGEIVTVIIAGHEVCKITI